MKLSVSKTGQLSPDLLAVKRKLGLSLITFEDASVELDPFVRVHPFETINFLTNAVVKHYQVCDFLSVLYWFGKFSYLKITQKNILLG